MPGFYRQSTKGDEMKNRILIGITVAAVAVVMIGLSLTGIETKPALLAVMTGAAAWLALFAKANEKGA
jgi:hypothetical protein